MSFKEKRTRHPLKTNKLNQIKFFCLSFYGHINEIKINLKNHKCLKNFPLKGVISPAPSFLFYFKENLVLVKFEEY
jgi:hypothetical protein